MTRRLNILLALFLLLFGAPYYWLLLENGHGDARAKPLHIAALRTLAASLPGQAPSGVEYEVVASRSLPGDLFVAGSGFKRKLVAVMAWRLSVPGGKPILIDSGLTASDAKSMGMTHFSPANQARVEQAMDGAGTILVTHEHPDHLGALAAHGRAALQQAARLNPAQLPPAPLATRLRWSGPDPRPDPVLGKAAPAALAPGVVVIPAPSHTPGSQMVYARLADGREYLFTGDIATFAQSWIETRARSRLVGDWIAPEDRAEVYSWLLTIKALKQENPRLIVVPGHDFRWIADEANSVGASEGFTSARSR
ncbi:MAG TPA: MBL fold metallo-hydrolase [Novosphingobium sp.]|nr:MBL fold metallo-hydrolase [Novosphingobium sp.]